MAALARSDLTDPESWGMESNAALSLEVRCVAALRSQGIPATGVKLDDSKLKGGYICDTMRISIQYDEGGGSNSDGSR